MSNSTTEYQPAIPNIVRTGVYVLGVATGFASIIIIGIAAIVWPDNAQDVVAVVGVVGTAVGWLSSALGTAYRPTAVLPGSGTIKGSAPPTP